MKTTIEISDELLVRSRKLAARQGISLRALVEEGLRLALRSRTAAKEPALELPTFGGDGLTPRYRDAGLHRAILDSYASPRDPDLDPEAALGVHDRDRS